jgi:tripartite-type tricarboxylate transporter receptor subunit TctC
MPSPSAHVVQSPVKKGRFGIPGAPSRSLRPVDRMSSRRLCRARLPLLGLFGALLLGALSSVVWAPPAEAQNNWTYQGRTVTISVASPPGGGYDVFARLLARHLPRHLPGNPSVIVKNMIGAGGLVLATYLQAAAPRDGTEIGALEHGTAFTSLLTKVRVSFDPLELGWLGSMEQFTPIVAVWHTVPIYSADDLMKTPISRGATIKSPCKRCRFKPLWR